MSIPILRQRRPAPALALLSVALGVSAALTVQAAATAAGQTSLSSLGATTTQLFKAGNYVVVLKAPAAARYAGGVTGLKATRGTAGRAFNGRTAAARAYSSHLRATQNTVARGVGASVIAHYTIATNGFAAHLTSEQATKLSADRSVLMVSPDALRKQTTWHTPTFLGLEGKQGAWKKYAGGFARAGDGIVIGDLDSGITPESKSFTGRPLTATPRGKWGVQRSGNTIVMSKRTGGSFVGECQMSASLGGGVVDAVDWDADDCTSKIVGARYYPDEFVASVPPEHWGPAEVLSARDGDSHGTHTASTAAGNHGVPASVEGVKFGPISGMAPAARLAVYKVCWQGDSDETTGCADSAILSAIDDAIVDNVDVINFSISGVTDTVVDPVEFAFEGAAEAGVFVSAAAGNEGPAEDTVAHDSPWLTTVGASTSYSYLNTVVLGNGKQFRGASISNTAVANHPLVYAGDVAAPAAADPDLCAPDSLDAAKVTGKVVMCNRGVYDRVAKSAEVKRAGGVAMILGNTASDSLDADFHSVPTVHVDDTDAAKIRSYISANPATAKAKIVLGDTTGQEPIPLPQIAPFSSRGPSSANAGDLIKPDLTAPGVSILAAVAPAGDGNRKFDLESGTSMAAPHVSGLAAFILGVHPTWTPMQVKSAMMTTATKLKNAKGSPTNDPWTNGSGNVNPRSFFEPGLFVTSSPLDWRRFLQGQGLDLGVEPQAASDFNGPSIATSALLGSGTLKRTFTAQKKGTWKVAVTLPGFKVTPSRKWITAAHVGDRVTLSLQIQRRTAPFDEYAAGSLILTGPTTVRLPIAVRPARISAPTVVHGGGNIGTTDVVFDSGFTGTEPIVPLGLAQAQTETASVSAGSRAIYCFEVTDSTLIARFDLDASDDASDLDLYVVPVAGDTCDADVADAIAISATGAADESVDLVQPDPGRYAAVVDGFAAPPGQASADFRLDFYDLDSGATAGSLQVTPNPVPVVSGQEAGFTASWSGLTSGERYFGLLLYGSFASIDALTEIYIDGDALENN